jgi:hypothetical protein
MNEENAKWETRFEDGKMIHILTPRVKVVTDLNEDGNITIFVDSVAKHQVKTKDFSTTQYGKWLYETYQAALSI